jgi:hypothetical protein
MAPSLGSGAILPRINWSEKRQAGQNGEPICSPSAGPAKWVVIGSLESQRWNALHGGALKTWSEWPMLDGLGCAPIQGEISTYELVLLREGIDEGKVTLNGLLFPNRPFHWDRPRESPR